LQEIHHEDRRILRQLNNQQIGKHFVLDAAQLIAASENPKPVSGAAGVLSDVNWSGGFGRRETLANGDSGRRGKPKRAGEASPEMIKPSLQVRQAIAALFSASL
jgi:hypothetical protein